MRNLFDSAYEKLVWAVSYHLPTLLLIAGLVFCAVFLFWSLRRDTESDPIHLRRRRTYPTRRQQGQDLIDQGNGQIQDAEQLRQDAAAHRAAAPPRIPEAEDCERQAAVLMNAGQQDVDRGHQLLEENPESYPRQLGVMWAMLAGIALLLVLLVGYVGWMNSESTVSSSDAARATKNLVAKAQTVYAPGYEILVDGSRFELHMPFGGLPPVQQTEWKAAIDKSISDWNAANPYKRREFVSAESASMVGYTKDGKFQGVLLTFTVKQWDCDHDVTKDLNFVHPMRGMNPSSVVRTADSLAQKLDTLAAGGGTPAGLPGMGPLQEAAPQF